MPPPLALGGGHTPMILWGGSRATGAGFKGGRSIMHQQGVPQALWGLKLGRCGLQKLVADPAYPLCTALRVQWGDKLATLLPLSKTPMTAFLGIGGQDRAQLIIVIILIIIVIIITVDIIIMMSPFC